MVFYESVYFLVVIVDLMVVVTLIVKKGTSPYWNSVKINSFLVILNKVKMVFLTQHLLTLKIGNLFNTYDNLR